MTALDPAKREARKQWDADPCGASTVRTEVPGSLAFYRAIRHHRYTVYAPWFEQAVEFSAYQNLDILEIGGGLGSDHYCFARHGNRMTALDLSTVHLQHTRRHLALESLHTMPIQGDAEDLPFPAGAFDLVYSFGALHHTPHTEAAIAEIRRVLKSDGMAIISLYHRNSWFFWLHRILARGVLLGGLITKGLSGVLSEIEYREHSDSAVPLVKVYTRRQVKALMRSFRSCRVQTRHVDAAHFPGLRWMLKRYVKRSLLERYFGRGGWYLIATVRK